MINANQALSLDRDSIIQPLKAGSVPLEGLEHFRVGRANEIAALTRDIRRIKCGGSAFRLIAGESGSGKTYFLQTLRSWALKDNMVFLSAMLSCDKQLTGVNGEPQRLYHELISQLTTLASPMGASLANVVERFVVNAVREARERGMTPDQYITKRMAGFEAMAIGFDFIHVIQQYWEALDLGEEELRRDVLRWLAADFSTRDAARDALGVCAIIDDSNWFDALKLMARFVKLAGYQGLLVALDDLSTLTDIDSEQRRFDNYERLHHVINECWLPSTPGLGIVCCASKPLLDDEVKGVNSHPGLQSLLSPNRFSKPGIDDWTNPILRLRRFTRPEMLQLLENLWFIYSDELMLPFIFSYDDLILFSDSAEQLLGEAFLENPRLTIKTFLDFLAVRECNPELSNQHIFQTLHSPRPFQ